MPKHSIFFKAICLKLNGDILNLLFFPEKDPHFSSSKMQSVLNQVPSKMLWNIKNYVKAPETLLMNCNKPSAPTSLAGVQYKVWYEVETFECLRGNRFIEISLKSCFLRICIYHLPSDKCVSCDELGACQGRWLLIQMFKNKLALL